jgi:hypothetical protein
MDDEAVPWVLYILEMAWLELWGRGRREMLNAEL